MKKRRSFSTEFKREAVRLMESSGKQAADLARDLGVPRNRLYKWKELKEVILEFLLGHRTRRQSWESAAEPLRSRQDVCLVTAITDWFVGKPVPERIGP